MSADVARGTAEEDEFIPDTPSMVNEGIPDRDALYETSRPPCDQASGTQLRHRLVTAESIAQLAATEKPGLLKRLLRRK
ncbi:MAG: hypothetical protein P8Y58_04625 [Novosphingobium sp.]